MDAGSLSLNRRRVIAFGKLATGGCRGGGIKDDCANLQLKGGKIWTDRESVDLKIVQMKRRENCEGAPQAKRGEGG